MNTLHTHHYSSWYTFQYNCILCKKDCSIGKVRAAKNYVRICAWSADFHFCHNNYVLPTFALLVSLMSVWFWYHITCRADCVPAFTIHDVSCHCMQSSWRILLWELHYVKCLTVLCLCSAGGGGKKWFSIFGKRWTYKRVWRSGRNDPGKRQRVHLPLFFYNHPPEPATRYM